jgi:hypothetical protein
VNALDETVAAMLANDDAALMRVIDRMLANPTRSRLAQDFLLDRRLALLPAAQEMRPEHEIPPMDEDAA